MVGLADRKKTNTAAARAREAQIQLLARIRPLHIHTAGGLGAVGVAQLFAGQAGGRDACSCERLRRKK